MHVLVTRQIPGDVFAGSGLDVDVWEEDRPMPRKLLLERVRHADALLCMLNDRIDREVIDSAPSLKVVANYAVGFDNIDLSAAKERGAAVTNTPGVLTDATADMAWALLFAASRRIVPGDSMVRTGSWGGWAPTLLLGADISGATLGIVGAGRIGTAMALRSAGFGMRTIYASGHSNKVLDEKLGAKKVSLEELLAAADFISLHVPLTPETRHMIDGRALSKMKKSAVIVNTSRGPVIDEKALASALSTGAVMAAGLDVFENEPGVAEGLVVLDNCVLAPHLGSATIGTRTKMARMAFDNITAVLEGREPLNRVA